MIDWASWLLQICNHKYQQILNLTCSKCKAHGRQIQSLDSNETTLRVDQGLTSVCFLLKVLVYNFLDCHLHHQAIQLYFLNT